MAEIHNNPYNQYQQQFNGYNVPAKGNYNSGGYLQNRVMNANEDDSDWSRDVLLEGTKYGIPMSAAFVHLTNWLMKPKKITDTMTQLESYQNSRMFKMGQWLDNLTPIKWIVRKTTQAGNALKKIPVPNAFKEMWSKIKIGTTSTWDSTGMYTQGKKLEAMKEALTYFSEAGDDVIRNLGLTEERTKLLLKLMEKVRADKINTERGFKILDRLLKNTSAKQLDEAITNHTVIQRILGTKHNLNLTLSKARFFAGLNNKGPFGRFFGKMVSLIGEASGGGVLGGTPALVINALGLASGFTAARKAEKGDKLSAFMEDYMGLTLGSYLGTMFEGWLMHHLLGAAEHGMQFGSKESIELAKSMGLKGANKAQDLVIAFNKEFTQNKQFQKILNKFAKGKIVENEGIPIFSWLFRKLTGKMTVADVEAVMKKAGIKASGNDINSLRTTLQGAVKDKNYFNNLRGRISQILKPKTTFLSMFKRNTGKTFGNRFFDWLTQGPIAKIAKTFATGKYTLLKDGNFIGNNFRRFKRVGGGIGRMILIAFVLVGPISNAAMKLSHLIFGKPKNSKLDSKNEPSKNQPQNNPKLNPNNQAYVPFSNPKSRSLIDLYTEKKPQETTPSQATKDVKQTIQTSQDEDKNDYDTATYVPNQMLTQESFIDPNVTDDLLARRDLAIKRAEASERNFRDLMSRI